MKEGLHLGEKCLEVFPGEEKVFRRFQESKIIKKYNCNFEVCFDRGEKGEGRAK